MGAVGGGAVNLIKGFYNSPKGYGFAGGLHAIRREAPKIGGSFAVWEAALQRFRLHARRHQAKGGPVEPDHVRRADRRRPPAALRPRQRRRVRRLWRLPPRRHRGHLDQVTRATVGRRRSRCRSTSPPARARARGGTAAHADGVVRRRQRGGDGDRGGAAAAAAAGAAAGREPAKICCGGSSEGAEKRRTGTPPPPRPCPRSRRSSRSDAVCDEGG